MNNERMFQAVRLAHDLTNRVVIRDNISQYDSCFYVDRNPGEILKMGVWGKVGLSGTVACFAGYLGLDDWFLSEGLVPIVNTEHSYNPQFTLDALMPTYGEFVGPEALAEFFEIGYDEAHQLFGAQNLDDIDDVIRRLNVFIKVKSNSNLEGVGADDSA